MKTKHCYLGGDASKGYCDFVIVDHNKKTVEPNFRLDDTSSGHQALEKVLADFFSSYEDGEVTLHAGLESTGGYENNWLKMLSNQTERLPLKVSRVNPLGVSHNKKADMERNTTDKISARAIADYLVDHPKNIFYNQSDPFVSLRKEWQFIKLLKKQENQLLNQLESALYTSHPQLLKYWDHELANWFLMVLKAYPCAMKLGRATPKAVAKIPYVSLARAKELVESAKDSVGAEQDEVAQMRIKALAQQLLQLGKVIDEQTKFMIKSCPMPQIDILRSFRGIGEYSAVGLMLIIGDIKRFATCKALCSYVGIHPKYKKSGDGSWAFRMSKQGSKEARVILFNVAKSGIVYNEMIQKRYEYYQNQGKTKMSAIGILMHKIMRIVYGMLKNNTKYNPAIDEENRAKHIAKEKVAEPKPDRERRYQEPDQSAPISNTQRKRRQQKEEIEEKRRGDRKENTEGNQIKT